MDRPCLRVLYLDDNPFELERLAAALDPKLLGADLVVETESEVERFRERLGLEPPPDIVILDIDLGAQVTDGASLVQEARGLIPESVILMFSSLDDVPTVVACMSQGADDFLSKDSDRAELNLRVRRSYQVARRRRGEPQSRGTAGGCGAGREYAGATMEAIARRVPGLAATDASVHLVGESGTGKDVVVSLFERHVGPSRPFVRFDCGAVAPDDQTDMLFGRPPRGLFGPRERKSLAERAVGGWLVLDAVESLAPAAQGALSRAMRESAFRVLSLASDPLDYLIEEGQLSAALAGLLRAETIAIPPLRDRPGEIPAIASQLAATLPGGPYTIADPALDVLATLPWRTGNVRELCRCLADMARLHVNGTLTPLSLPASVWKQRDEAAVASTHPCTLWEIDERPDRCVLDLAAKHPPSPEACADALLLELIRKLTRYPPVSLRRIAKAVGMPRPELAARLDAMVAQRLLTPEGRAALVKRSPWR